MATHSSTLAWKIPWTEEPGGLQPMGSLRFGHNWATSLSLFTFMHWRRKWQPPPVFLPGESQGQGAWWAAIYGVAQSRTRLKWLSSSSSLNQWYLMLSLTLECTWMPDCVSIFIIWKSSFHKSLCSVQSLSHVWLFATSWTEACHISLSLTISQSLPM